MISGRTARCAREGSANTPAGRPVAAPAAAPCADPCPSVSVKSSFTGGRLRVLGRAEGGRFAGSGALLAADSAAR